MAWQLLGYALPALTTIRTLGWEVAKRRFPKLTKEVFSKIKTSKNKKIVDAEKVKPKKIKAKKKDVKKDTKPKKKDTKPKKKDTKPKKKDTKPKDTTPKERGPFDPKIKGEGPPAPGFWAKEAGQWKGLWNMLPAGLRNQISKAGPGAWKGLMLDFKPFSAIPGPASRKIVKGAIQFGLGYGALKAYDVIKGEGGMVTGGDNIDMKTGNVDTQTDEALDAPTSGVGEGNRAGMNEFIDAHNTALNTGQAEFTYAGRTYTVGTVPMRNF